MKLEKEVKKRGQYEGRKLILPGQTNSEGGEKSGLQRQRGNEVELKE